LLSIDFFFFSNDLSQMRYTINHQC